MKTEINKYRNQINIIFLILAIIIEFCLVYLPNNGNLGLYRDDWNNFYTATVKGPEAMLKHYEADRPADGVLTMILFKMFSTDITAYHTYNLVCRLLSALAIAFTIFVLIPNRPALACYAGLLTAVFPGFRQQVNAISYTPHQTAYLFYCVSFLLTAVSLNSTRRLTRYISMLFSVLLSVAGAFLMEYYIGFEAYRAAIICYCVIKNNKTCSKTASLKELLSAGLPYLLGLTVFVVWRALLFDAKRNGTDVESVVIAPLLSHPRHALASLFVTTVRSVFRLNIGSFYIPVYDLFKNMEMKEFFSCFLTSFGIALLINLFPACISEREQKQQGIFVTIGLITGTAAIFPLILSGRDISFVSSLDRFSLVGVPGAVLVVLGLSENGNKISKRIILFSAVLISVMVQTKYIDNYAREWKEAKSFWQQLLVRAPMIEKNTVLVSGDTLIKEEDYDIFAPASMIYYPKQDGKTPVGAEILNAGTVQKIKDGVWETRTTREIIVEKDYKNVLVLTKPSSTSCLRIIDGTNPVYSQSDKATIKEIGQYSDISRVVTDSDNKQIPFFFGLSGLSDYGWCYYYQMVSLELQRGNPEQAAFYANIASRRGLKWNDPIESIPLIEAYVLSGDIADAEIYVNELARSNDTDKASGCKYFSTKEDERYSGVLNVLCDQRND